VALLVVAFATGSLTKQLAANLLTSLEQELLAEDHGVSGLLGGGVLSDVLSELWHTEEDDEHEKRIGHRLFNIFSVLGGGVGFEGEQEGEGNGNVKSLGRSSKEGAAITFLLGVVRTVRTLPIKPLLVTAVLGTGAVKIVGSAVQKGLYRRVGWPRND
jgi:hypothetical protein